MLQNFLATAVLLCLTACGSPTTPATTNTPTAPAEPALPPARLQLADGPVMFTVTQRLAFNVPQSNGEVVLKLDDITGGQVLVSVLLQNNTVLAGPTSMREGATLGFALDARTYTVELVKFDLEMITADKATFRVSEVGIKTPHAAAPVLMEKQKIETLISHVASLENATFIRNGDPYTPKDAADHMRMKWNWAGDRVSTAEQFIDELASKSSQSGKPYTIKLSDGREVEAGAYLHEQLKGLDASASP